MRLRRTRPRSDVADSAVASSNDSVARRSTLQSKVTRWGGGGGLIVCLHDTCRNVGPAVNGQSAAPHAPCPTRSHDRAASFLACDYSRRHAPPAYPSQLPSNFNFNKITLTFFCRLQMICLSGLGNLRNVFSSY